MRKCWEFPCVKYLSSGASRIDENFLTPAAMQRGRVAYALAISLGWLGRVGQARSVR